VFGVGVRYLYKSVFLRCKILFIFLLFFYLIIIFNISVIILYK